MTDQKKKLYCHYCGQDLGYATRYNYPGDIESCGSPRCEESASEMHRERQENAMMDALDDGYSLYGGDW